ncbi:MAG: asparaginase [Hyphomicrobiales bacterium]
MTGNPTLVEVTRGRIVESVHRGALAVVDAGGAVQFSVGDIETPVFPRSAIKAFQAIPLVESGAADAYGFSDRELALACASHSGEPRHLEVAAAMLAAAGRDETALECGAHWPRRAEDIAAMGREGRLPAQLHNNCSGKHAGFVCLSCHAGHDHRGYVDPDHPVQRRVASVLAEMTGARVDETVRGIDGCSAPNWALPLRALAHGFARFATGEGLSSDRAAAAGRLRAACAAEPWMVAGTGRFCTIVMEALGERAFVKVGAEGIYCGAFPEVGLGFAIKCDDGAARAAEVVAASLIARFVRLKDSEQQLVSGLVQPVLENWRGTAVGRLRPGIMLRGRLGI